MRTRAAALAIGLSLLLGSTAQAGIVLSDDFDSDGPLALNWPGDAVFTSDSVNNSSTDLIGPGFYDLAPGHGNYVDLDGSTGDGNEPAGQLTSIASFGAGSYELSFLLAGNLRGYFSQTTDVYFANQLIASITPANNSPFTLYDLFFSSAIAGNLVFLEHGPSDQQGNLLDDVVLQTVPEPSVIALIGIALLSLFGFGVIRRPSGA